MGVGPGAKVLANCSVWGHLGGRLRRSCAIANVCGIFSQQYAMQRREREKSAEVAQVGHYISETQHAWEMQDDEHTER